MAGLSLAHLGLEVAAEAVVVAEETEAREMIVTGEDVTEVIGIQMTGRDVARTIVPMASGMTETDVTTKVTVVEPDVMTEVPATTTDTESVRRRRSMSRES